MKVDRKELVEKLTLADLGRVGGSELETLIQCRSYVLKDKQLITFNGEICCKIPTELDFDVAIPGDDFKRLLQKFPDDEIELEKKNNEIVITGKRKKAGILFEEIQLPYDEIPDKGTWSIVDPDVPKMLKFASNTCGKDYAQILTTLVHITPDYIEASDNFRLFRGTVSTGFSDNFCLRGATAREISRLDLSEVCHKDGWLHFKCEDGAVVSCRCAGEEYHDNIGSVLAVTGEECVLPSNLADILERAQVMQDTDSENPKAFVQLNKNELYLKTQKDQGWYEERKRIKYDGEEIKFQVNPQFLYDILSYTRKVVVAEKRIKIEVDNIEFVAALVIGGE